MKTLSDLTSEAAVIASPSRIPRALRPSPSFWFSMLAASAFGTNLGDFTVDTLSLRRATSFALLAVITGLAVWSDTRYARRTEAGYWAAIVLLRAAATNVGDFLTHDLAIGYLAATVFLGAATLVAGCFTRIDAAQSGTPLVDGRYWSAMLIAGIFGTIGGDLAAHTTGLYAATAVLCGLTVLVLVLRNRFAATSVLAYWCVVLAERCAGTPVGDALASHRAVGLGLPRAMACNSALLAIGLLARWHELPRRTPPGSLF